MKLKVLPLILLLLLPISVNANIMCNDGTISPTCTTCGSGCCSHHGGCSKNYSNDFDDYEEFTDTSVTYDDMLDNTLLANQDLINKYNDALEENKKIKKEIQEVKSKLKNRNFVLFISVISIVILLIIIIELSNIIDELKKNKR